MSNNKAAETGMVLVTVLWASCYVVAKIAMGDGLTPNWLTALRFIGAAAALALAFAPRLRYLDRATLLGGTYIGLAIGAGYIVQTVGLTMTTASKVGFLTSLYVVLVPVMDCSLKRTLPALNEAAGVGLATVGLAVLSLKGGLSFSLGDGLVFLGAVFFAVGMILVDRFSGPCDPMALSVVQIAVAGLMALVCALFTEEAPSLSGLGPAALIGVVYLIFFGTAVNTAVQNWAQSIISPTLAALIFVLEPIFSGIFGFFIMGDPMGVREIAGSALIISGTLVTLLAKPKNKS